MDLDNIKRFEKFGHNFFGLTNDTKMPDLT